MADIVKQILAKPIQYADEVIKLSDQASFMKAECTEIKGKTERLAALLRQAARASGDLYERPTRRIIDDTEQVLDKALTLVFKCRSNGIRRIFTIIPAAAFKKVQQQLENSIGDVSWLLRVSAPADDRDDEYLGLPPIAANEPILCLIWEQIAILCSGGLEEKADAAASLVSLARDNDRYGSLIIEEGGVAPLLKLAKEGRMEGQENAARAIGLLGRDPESVEMIVNAGVCQVFAKILKEGHMKVQIVVAWAISELAANHRKCQDPFAQHNIIRLLVSHLAFETIPEHSKYAIASKHSMSSIHSILMANNSSPKSKTNEDVDDKSVTNHPMDNQMPSQMHNIVTNTMALKSTILPNKGTTATATATHVEAPGERSVKANKQNNQLTNEHHHHHKHKHHGLPGSSIKRREFEDPSIKAEMKAMAARALRYLCAGNVGVCQSITESRALLCLAVLLEKGEDEVKYNSAMALMEITDVAEHDAELRRSAFKPTAPVAKAVVDQFLRIVQKADCELLIPSIRSIGSLARTFRATETRFIPPLVNLLDDREPEVSCEAALALNKFACPENFLHDTHCKSIISHGGHKHLIPLIYFGEQMVQIPSFILLCYLAMHVPDSETLAQEDVLIALEWSTKQQHFMQDDEIVTLVYEAKKRFELYQSRASKQYH
ncbi:armadillo repeat only 1 [Perilla frutescens var. frutescens]|nr:armadillo repeat only 1 [Perilla frutescens var. frutescens]